MSVFRKVLLLLSVFVLLIGCSQSDNNSDSNTTSEVERRNEEKAIAEAKFYKKDMFINDELKDVFSDDLIEEYTYLKNINYIEDTIKADVLVDKDSYNETIKRINNTVSLLYSLSKEFGDNFKNIHINFISRNQIVYDTNISIKGVKDILSSMGDGIDHEFQFKLYEMFGILDFIKRDFSEEYKSINNEGLEVEIMRNKGETDEIFADALLFNINKISNGAIKDMIDIKEVNITNIHLDDSFIKSDLMLDFSKKATDEIIKIVDAMSILYSFSDFNNDIVALQVNVLNQNKEKIETYSITLENYQSLLQSSDISNEPIDIKEKLDFTSLVKKFDN